MNPLDIAIAGCGPAGLAAELSLARDGHRITLFERFAAPRPIGSRLMIQPTGLAALRELGLADTILAHGARINRLRGLTGRGRVALDATYSALPGPARFGLGVHRAALFGALVYQSDSRVLPVLRYWLVGPLAKTWPTTTILAAIVAGLIGSPPRRLGLSRGSPRP